MDTTTPSNSAATLSPDGPTAHDLETGQLEDLEGWSDDEGDADADAKGVGVFAAKLEETVQCGCIFLVVWCFQYWRRPIVDISSARSRVQRERILFAGVMLCCLIAGQLLLYISLSWAMVEAAVRYPGGNSSFCPGQDSHPDGSYDWMATPAQNLTIAAALIILLVNLTFDWLNTHMEFYRFMGSYGLEAKPPMRHLRSDLRKMAQHRHVGKILHRSPPEAAPPTPEQAANAPHTRREPDRFQGAAVLRALQQRYGSTVYSDFMSHVLMTVVIYVMTIFALFFMSTVGKMVTTMFALKFLEEIDDEAKRTALRLTNIAKVMYLRELAIGRREQQPPTFTVDRLMFLGFLFFEMLYVFVFAAAIWAFVWTGMGCKPGTQNAFEFF